MCQYVRVILIHGKLIFQEYFHNAYLYEQSGFKFLNPEYEGMFQSLLRCLSSDMKTRGLADVSWAVTEGKVVCAVVFVLILFQC